MEKLVLKNCVEGVYDDYSQIRFWLVGMKFHSA